MGLTFLQVCHSHIYPNVFFVQDLQGLRWEHLIMPYLPGAHNNTPETLYLITSSILKALLFMRTLIDLRQHYHYSTACKLLVRSDIWKLFEMFLFCVLPRQIGGCV
jgi:hypothetical protein